MVERAGRPPGTLAVRPRAGIGTTMVQEAAAVAARVVYVAAWAMVLVMAAFVVMTLMHVDHGSSSLLVADERVARAIASPFKFLNGLELRHGWG
jgi:hypothetical protein